MSILKLKKSNVILDFWFQSNILLIFSWNKSTTGWVLFQVDSTRLTDATLFASFWPAPLDACWRQMKVWDFDLTSGQKPGQSVSKIQRSRQKHEANIMCIASVNKRPDPQREAIEAAAWLELLPLKVFIGTLQIQDFDPCHRWQGCLMTYSVLTDLHA